MSLILGNPLHAASDGPKTHVLIIGVNAYPFLRGGVQERADLALNLHQLTSPTLSAKHLADWMLRTPLDNPAAPLGSVELLLSPAQNYQTPDDQNIPVEAATLDNIQTAFTAWDARCNADAANVAIFYFCGHGLQKETLVLLPEDFGSLPVVWHGAIDFQKTYRNMAVNQAMTQLYFIDACRELAFDTLVDPDFGGVALRPGRLGVPERRAAPVIYATSQGRQAFAPDDKVSYFTSALVNALNGQGVVRRQGRWVIHTDSIGTKIRDLVSLNNRKLNLEKRFQQNVDPQGTHIQDRVIHCPHQLPDVEVEVLCQPPQANELANLYIRKNSTEVGRRAPAPEAWQIAVPCGGPYRIGAEFAQPTFRNAFVDEIIEPPSFPVRIEVT